MTEFFTIVLNKNKDSWFIKFSNKKGQPTKEIFKELKDAEKWIENNYPYNWIDHQIGDSEGHLMLFEDWASDVKCGGFIDYDGWGNVLDKEFNTLKDMYSPSNYKGRRPRNARYVLWFNR